MAHAFAERHARFESIATLAQIYMVIHDPRIVSNFEQSDPHLAKPSPEPRARQVRIA
jgi:hypothetical protein